MITKSVSLQAKILFGYLVLMAVIISMAAILFHERARLRELEADIVEIRQVRGELSEIHRNITVLASLGESVIAWEEEDYRAYQTRRLRVDSLLQVLKIGSDNMVDTNQIDTLRGLLSSKEGHLYQIMQVFHRQDKADSLLVNHLSEAARQAIQPRTVMRKKKGIAGLFGGKETVEVPASPNRLRSLNEQLIALQTERIRNMEGYTDSLRVRNKDLNRKLFALLGSINNHAQAAFQDRERYIAQAHNYSTSIITGLIVAAIVLLVFSYLIIHKHLKWDVRLRDKMKGIIDKNNELLETRKNIILTISHDIRAPLNIINGSAELAADIRDRKRRNHHLTNIGIVCRHILHLLNNLLDVYRLNESKETCNNVPFSLNDWLERIATGFSNVVNNKGILFLCDFKDTDVVLHGDIDRIAQIIDNLLANAVKFTNSGTIRFNAAYKDGNLSLEIKDTGIGMDEDTLSRIFRPFERLVSEMNADGFGLGLPITQGLVNLLGGKIDVESEPGHGSTFRVLLPLPVSDERIEHEASALRTTFPLPQSVLVIDNDRLQLEIVKEMLERNGVSCTACSNAKELVKEMRKQDYDLLLSDIQMPGTNGFEILALLRNSNIGNSRTIPVIAMTARGDREKEAFTGSGFADCVYKPFSMNELLNTISAVISHTEPEEPCVPDFDTFTADVRDKRKLLRTFISQSNRDIKDLRSAMGAGDRAGLREIAHKIQPSLELLQSYGPFYDFREVLKDETAGKDVIEEYTRRIIKHISMLVTEAENTINKIAHETENTDS